MRFKKIRVQVEAVIVAQVDIEIDVLDPTLDLSSVDAMERKIQDLSKEKFFKEFGYTPQDFDRVRAIEFSEFPYFEE